MPTLLKCTLCQSRSDADKVIAGKSVNFCHQCFRELLKEELESKSICNLCQTDDAVFLMKSEELSFPVCKTCLALAYQILNNEYYDDDSIYCRPKEKG
ncbi:MAG: hypothetical protein KIT34_06660 [Cyanobacteria bacterium TGS_CYA1]|nr:hypothetical protein [Cyanobacteria bacterium TGS_CYA1]